MRNSLKHSFFRSRLAAAATETLADTPWNFIPFFRTQFDFYQSRHPPDRRQPIRYEQFENFTRELRTERVHDDRFSGSLLDRRGRLFRRGGEMADVFGDATSPKLARDDEANRRWAVMGSRLGGAKAVPVQRPRQSTCVPST